MFARALARLFDTAPRTPIRNPRRTRLNAEALEARDVPASYYWHPTDGNPTGNPAGSSSMSAANWTSPDAPGTVPGGGSDDVYFANVKAGSIDDCADLGATTGTFHSVNLIWGYTGTVTVAAAFQTQGFVLDTGTIDQPYTPGGSDITVTGSFSWTGGTLNSTSNVANVTLDGATGSIAPLNAGAVSLGSNLSVINAALLTCYAGTVSILNDNVVFEVFAESGLVIDPGKGSTQDVVASQGVTLNDNLYINTDAWVEVRSGTYRNGGRAFNRDGRFTILSGCVAEFSNKADPNGNPAYKQSSGLTQLYGGSRLVTGGGQIVEIWGGKLGTVDDGTTANAMIQAFSLNVLGGEVVIGEGTAIHRYGTLDVYGNIKWQGGTYRPAVLGAQDEGPADLWRCSGTFEIDRSRIGGFPDPVLAPVSLDYEYSQSRPLQSNWTWLVMEGDAGITAPAGNNPPTMSGPFTIAPVAGNPIIRWRIKSVVN